MHHTSDPELERTVSRSRKADALIRRDTVWRRNIEAEIFKKLRFQLEVNRDYSPQPKRSREKSNGIKYVIFSNRRDDLSIICVQSVGKFGEIQKCILFDAPMIYLIQHCR